MSIEVVGSGTELQASSPSYALRLWTPRIRSHSRITGTQRQNARHSRLVRVRGLCVARVGRIGRWVVQWNAEPDLYSAASDAHLLDQESEQPLPASEIELLETAANSLGKGGDAAAEAVVVGQLGSRGFQLRLLLLQLQPAAIYLWHSPLQLPQR